MTRQISRKGTMPDHHIKLVSILEKKGFVVMRWQSESEYRVISERKAVEWDINSGKWRDIDSDSMGKGIQQMIFFLGGF